MSLGGAVMLLGENLGADVGRPALFMLGLARGWRGRAHSRLRAARRPSGRLGVLRLSRRRCAPCRCRSSIFVALLLLIGFGAKLGLLPFYEWFPGAYGSGSGATGALLSGVVLNAAFFALSRSLLDWLPVSPGWPVSAPGVFIVAAAVASAILTALYAFQEEDGGNC